jgi:hypothetical protein
MLLFTAVVATGLMLYRWWPVDGVAGILGPLVFGDDTVWATGYTDAGFRAVRIGMSRTEIYALLGPPLHVMPTKTGQVAEGWTTLDSSPNAQCNLFVRQIWFQGDTATSIVAEFSPD